jgi:hypothetical protein
VDHVRVAGVVLTVGHLEAGPDGGQAEGAEQQAVPVLEYTAQAVLSISTYWLGPTSPTGSGGIGMPPRMGMLAVAGMPSKLTVGAAIAGLTPALVLDACTGASPAKPSPAAALGAAPWAVPLGAEMTRPVTSSSGSSQRARVRSLTVGPFLWPWRPGGVVAG